MTKPNCTLLGSTLLFLGTLAAPASAQCELARLVASDGELSDRLGSRVAISGDFGLLAAKDHDAQGSGSGAVYVAEPGPNGWSVTQKLMASDGAEGTRFGVSVAIDGDRALIGASHAVYAFEHTPSGWVEVQKILASDGVPGDQFGGNVAIHGDRALIAAPGQPTAVGDDVGAVYVFEHDGSAWVEVEKLSHPEPAAGDSFGQIALYGDVAVVGAPGHDLHGFYGKGAVYVFERDDSGWSHWTKLTIYEGIDGDSLGSHVDIHRNRIAISARGEDSIESGRGAAYVFRKAGAGWVREARLVPDGPVAHGFAYHGIAIDGDKVVVPCYLGGDPGDQFGLVFVYKRTDEGWLFDYRFHGSSPTGSLLGWGISVDGDRILVGAPHNGDLCQDHNPQHCSSGAAHLFSASVETSFNYCDTAANSTGSPAVISMGGCVEVARNELRLFARPVPEGMSGVFFYGDRSLAPVPFGDGSRCVGGRVFRLPLTHAVDEELAVDVDLVNPPQSTGQILAGSTWSFQAYYRDPAAGGAGFNLSDALEVAFPN